MPVSDVYLVLDDCHKLIDKVLLEELTKMTADGWSGARIVLISEEKIPELRAAGIKESHVTGLEPKEGIFFLARLGVEVGGALTELAMLCVQADGHPAMLRAIASELPSRPSPEDVKKLSQTLHTALSVKPFVDVLSERLVKSWRSDSHRQWVMRLAVLAFPFRHDLAMRIAELEPKIAVNMADWNYLSSQFLDQSGADQYTVPALLRPLLTSPGQQPGGNEILIASARYVFRTASASNRMDFWDFHGAILALVLAQRYDEAAMYFLMSLKASMQLASFSYFEILFMVLNSDVIQEKFKDTFPKFTLLSCELQMRLQLESPPDYTRIMDLLRRMRLLTRVEITRKPLLYDRIQVHQAIAAIRLRRIMEKKSFDVREGRRAFVPIQAALRLVVSEKDADLTRLAARMYVDLHFLEKQPDLEVLKDAILLIPERSLRAYGGKVVSLYTNFVISKMYDDPALVLCERHAGEYRQAGRGNGFFACEHAAATILFDRFSKFKEARDRIVSASTAALQIGASPDLVARTNLFVADSYWAEKNYVSSAKYYEKAALADLGDEALNQWTSEKLADSLIFMGHFEEAALSLVETLRERHSSLFPEYTARYYARLAYAYAECNLLRKASVACQGLSRVARQSNISEIDRLSAIVSGWVLQHFKYSDPGLPKATVSIRDSSALSEQPSPEQMDAWKSSGPAFTRGLMLVGTLFELLGEYRRSENIYHRAIETYRCSDKNLNRPAGSEHAFQLRVARVQVRRHNVCQAAETFRLAAEGLFELRNQDVPGSSIGASVFATATIVEPCLESCSDSEVMEFFGEVEKQFAAQSGARAWLLFKQSEILFGRLMVQVARRTLLDAEAAARSSDECQLLWSILYSELFSHIDQMYRNQFAWITDALETGLTLSNDERLAAQRSQFGDAVFRLTSRIVAPMGDIGNAITKFGDRAKKDQFLFAMLATWRVAKSNRLTTRCLPEVEQMLRNNGALVAADFE
jgi:tetratricopeptide (TPR) repeat protein